MENLNKNAFFILRVFENRYSTVNLMIHTLRTKRRKPKYYDHEKIVWACKADDDGSRPFFFFLMLEPNITV